MSVIAHVVQTESLPSEPAATHAPAQILDASPVIARAFVGILGQADIELEVGRVQAELGHKDRRPEGWKFFWCVNLA